MAKKKAARCGLLKPADLHAATKAYADANARHGGEGRVLHFLGRALRPTDAAKVMKAAVPDGYNEFDAKAVGDELKKHDVCVRFGREASPVLYVSGDPQTLNRLSGIAKRRLKADTAKRCVSVRVTPADPRYASSEMPISVACTRTGTGGSAPKGGKARWLKLFWD